MDLQPLAEANKLNKRGRLMSTFRVKDAEASTPNPVGITSFLMVAATNVFVGRN